MTRPAQNSTFTSVGYRNCSAGGTGKDRLRRVQIQLAPMRCWRKGHQLYACLCKPHPLPRGTTHLLSSRGLMSGWASIMAATSVMVN